MQNFRAFQAARVQELLTTMRCLYPGGDADVQ